MVSSKEFHENSSCLRSYIFVRGGIEGITDQGCSESKSIGALESECQRLVTAWWENVAQQEDLSNQLEKGDPGITSGDLCTRIEALLIVKNPQPDAKVFTSSSLCNKITVDTV
jgi:hypothetical protein